MSGKGGSSSYTLKRFGNAGLDSVSFSQHNCSVILHRNPKAEGLCGRAGGGGRSVLTCGHSEQRGAEGCTPYCLHSSRWALSRCCGERRKAEITNPIWRQLAAGGGILWDAQALPPGSDKGRQQLTQRPSAPFSSITAELTPPGAGPLKTPGTLGTAHWKVIRTPLNHTARPVAGLGTHR